MSSQKRDSSGRFAKKTEISKAKPRGRSGAFNFAPAGETGLKRNFGVISEEFLSDLSGNRAVEIYKEMRENDPVIGSIFFGIEMFLRKVNWFVDSFDDSPEQEEKAKFLRECKDDMSTTWPDFIAEVMSMMEHGWSWFEILYKIRTHASKKEGGEPQSKYNDSKIGWRKFEIRSQDSWEKWLFDEEGGIAGMQQRSYLDSDLHSIPIEKSLLFRTTSKKNNPEGRSVLRNAYRPWYFKKRMEEIEGIGVERDLAGLPFAEVPAEMLSPNASEADKATLESIVELVKNVRRDEQEGIVWPQSWDEKGNPQYQFKLLASSGSRQFNTSDIIGRYDSRIAMTVMMDFILLGTDSSGSFALSTNKTGMFQSALGVWLDMIQDVLNNYAVPRLYRLNGDVSGEYPKFRHDDVQKQSVADLATYIAALVGAGAQLFPDVELENHLRRVAQLPMREVEQKTADKEDELRDKNLDADIAMAKETIKNPAGPPPQQGLTGGKDPNAVPGAPTATTGRVKSKLPPAQRRDTKATRALANTVQKRRIVRRKK